MRLLFSLGVQLPLVIFSILMLRAFKGYATEDLAANKVATQNRGATGHSGGRGPDDMVVELQNGRSMYIAGGRIREGAWADPAARRESSEVVYNVGGRSGGREVRVASGLAWNKPSPEEEDPGGDFDPTMDPTTATTVGVPLRAYRESERAQWGTRV